ncbi:MAG: SDR family oxidoreductase [Nitrospinota bacterium]
MSGRFSLDGKVAVVSGILGKLGPVWARGLLDAGASVLGLDLPGAEVSPVYGDLQDEYGPRRIALARADVRERAALEEALRRCLAEFGVPSVLVNNAGIDQPPSPEVRTYLLEEIPIEDVRAVIEVNATAAFQVLQVFGREMVKARRGSAINIGSLYASVSPDARLYEHLPCDPPFLKPPGYGASKAALVNLTKYLAAHWGPYGVRVNALSPGGVLGGQDEEFQRKFCERVPLGRMAAYEDLIGPLVFLASDASSYVTGIELRVDGGYSAW